MKIFLIKFKIKPKTVGQPMIVLNIFDGIIVDKVIYYNLRGALF